MDNARKGSAFVFFLFSFGLYFTNFYSYLLFHSLVELFSIVIAFTIFIIGWHSRKHIDNRYFAFISIPYLYVGFLDLMHVLSYSGMQIFTDYDYYANQLWIAARYMESISILVAFGVLRQKHKLQFARISAVYAVITSLVLVTIFVTKTFPVCFVEGVGLTPFKVYSEYVICALLLVSILVLRKNKRKFDFDIYVYLMLSLWLTIVSELAFTFYIHNYGISNLVGHFFKLFSFYFIYRSIVSIGLDTPQKIIFKELSDTKERLEKANATKETLISVLAHDLRGPLGGIVQLFETYLEDKDIFSVEDMHGFIGVAHEYVSSSFLLLENTLHWVQMQKDTIDIAVTKIPLVSLVHSSIKHLTILAQQKNIQIHVAVDEAVMVCTDVELTKTVVRNIVSNAIKFCSENGEIRIVAEVDTDEVILKIQDNGQGMDKELLEKVFSVTRHDIASIKNAGTGLGLGLCKLFFELQDNRISIESALDVGTTVSLFFNRAHVCEPQ